MTEQECAFAEGCMARSNGHCMTMGTASTMASMAEALGMQLPYSATWPAVDARRYETAQRAGQVIVDLVENEVTPGKIMTREAFENAIRVNAAIGGSTNAVIHLLAIAGRLGVPLELDDFDTLIRDVPTLVNLQPSGKYLMEDFCYAGGLPAVMREPSGDLLHTGALTVTRKTVGENVEDAPCWNRDVIMPLGQPFQAAGTGTAVLRGNLAPSGAVIKQSAASPHLLKHRGRALVFDSPEAYHQVAADPDLEVDDDTVLIIRYCGPKGYPGMPETANVPLPPSCSSGASGTSCGSATAGCPAPPTAPSCCMSHPRQPSAAPSPWSAPATGSPSTSRPARSTSTSPTTNSRTMPRRVDPLPPRLATRGWTWLYTEHVQQADTGCDLDFLTGEEAAPEVVPRIPLKPSVEPGETSSTRSEYFKSLCPRTISCCTCKRCRHPCARRPVGPRGAVPRSRGDRPPSALPKGT